MLMEKHEERMEEIDVQRPPSSQYRFGPFCFPFHSHSFRAFSFPILLMRSMRSDRIDIPGRHSLTRPFTPDSLQTP